MLLELEWNTLCTKNTIEDIFNYCLDNKFDYNFFGSFLISNLEKIYYKEDKNTAVLVTKMYHIWRFMTSEIQMKEPFCTLCYEDDFLAWGDESKTRELYEKMF